nr:saccharopine dehydrogenase NADP-binding domain-containing protein [Lysinibacillus timonensis]
MKKVMVVGASGVLGQLVCAELLRIFENQIKLTVTDYKIERGKQLVNSFEGDVQFQYLDINDEENISQVIQNIDIVIVVLKQKTPLIQEACIYNKILCLDVTPFYGFVEKVIELNERAVNNQVGSVVMSGFFPGLSGLMVKRAMADFNEVNEINVGLLQNTNAKAGVSGILDMLTIVSKPVDVGDMWISGFTKKRKMQFLTPGRDKEVRLIHHSEKVLLSGRLTTNPIHYWTAWNSKPFNKLVSLFRQLGLLNQLHKLDHKILSKIVKHNPNQNESAFLTVEVKGIVGGEERIKRLSLASFSDYHTTAIVTAALAKIAHQQNVKGVACPFEITTLDELIFVMNCPNIVVEEVEG